VLQCVAVCCSVSAISFWLPPHLVERQCVAMGCSDVAVCGSVLQRVAVCCSVLQCVAVCCSVLQCKCRLLTARADTNEI